MSMAKGVEPLSFGHNAEAVIGIEGLAVSTIDVLIVLVLSEVFSY